MRVGTSTSVNSSQAKGEPSYVFTHNAQAAPSAHEHVHGLLDQAEANAGKKGHKRPPDPVLSIQQLRKFELDALVEQGSWRLRDVLIFELTLWWQLLCGHLPSAG